MKKKILVTCLLALLAVMLVSSVAFAHPNEGGDKTSTATACVACHGGGAYHTSGPHGGYTDSTDKCQTCHDLHAAGTGFGNGADNAVLLMGTTVTAACQFCHNLTQSEYAPYNMTGDFTAASGHKVIGINGDAGGNTAIPGGAIDGGTQTLYTNDQGKLSGDDFTCNSCHTPHGINTVEPYLGESQTKYNDASHGGSKRLYLTTRLLKTKPNGATTAVTTYGSAWCAACHQGRTGTPDGHVNHPVDLTKPAYQFLELAGIDSSAIVNGTLDIEQYGDPRSNKQYAMAITGENEVMLDVYGNKGVEFEDSYVDISNYTNGPTCQQCHASSRNVTEAFKVTIDQTSVERGNFPHISNTPYLLVQDGSDSFCANCHAPSKLP